MALAFHLMIVVPSIERTPGPYGRPVRSRSPGRVMFERPTKNDLDTALSLLMHESRHKLTDEVNRLKGDAIKVGALQSSRLVVAAISAADDVHKKAMEQAH